MYYITYGFFYLISLLPFRVLYFLSSAISFFLYNISGYRKKIVLENLAIAFPEKPLAERRKIAKKFYTNFIDTFVEMLKILSITDNEFDKRCTCQFDVINKIIAEGKNIYLVGGHLFSWEYANLVLSKNINISPVGVYGTIENRVFEKLVLKLRSRYGTTLIATHAFKSRMQEITKKQYCMFLLADQNPLPHNSIWINFFGRPAPFIPGPHRAAKKNNAAMIFISYKKVKRGFYNFSAETVIENAADHSVEDLIKKYRDFVESNVRRQPANYLWSHRRWKYNFKDFHEKYGGELIPD